MSYCIGTEKSANTDFIQQLYDAYCENNPDMFPSDVDEVLKANRKQISNSLSEDLAEKFLDILSVDSQKAFRCGFSVAMQLVVQGVSV